MAHLVVKKGSSQGTIYEIKSDRTVIGRGRVCDLILPDISVSRSHALLERSRDEGKLQYTIKDMDSKNAFFVNGKPTKLATLADSDTITVGKFVLLFRERREVESASRLDPYTLDGREDYLERVTALEGANVHSTTALSPKVLAEKVAILRRKEEAVIRRVGASESEWRPGEDDLVFGKGGASVAGMGLGGRVIVRWEETHHVIHKDGGWFCTLEVNQSAVDKATLASGDRIKIGNELFEYKV